MPDRTPAWAALNIHHELDGYPVFIQAGKPIPEWVSNELLDDWLAGGAATRDEPEGDG